MSLDEYDPKFSIYITWKWYYLLTQFAFTCYFSQLIIEFLHGAIWPDISFTHEKHDHSMFTVMAIYYLVLIDLIFNCVLFLDRHFLIVILMIVPYSLFEIMFPHEYEPIDLKGMLGIDLSFTVPILTILMIIFAIPVFYILKFI
jgi:hypothetical protein